MASKKKSAAKNKKQAQNEPQPFKRPNKLARLSKWQFALLFIIPFILAEMLFFFGGRPVSMVLFPFLWVGFWAALLWANDWSPLKKTKAEKNAE